jgi:ubiquinone/menaquinone biosynthesis C-methylase UbiE
VENSRCIDLLIIASLQKLSSDRVLEIATGIGEPAVTAATAVGDSSTNRDYVLAIDHSSQMLAIAKKKAMFLESKGLAW